MRTDLVSVIAFPVICCLSVIAIMAIINDPVETVATADTSPIASNQSNTTGAGKPEGEDGISKLKSKGFYIESVQTLDVEYCDIFKLYHESGLRPIGKPVMLDRCIKPRDKGTVSKEIYLVGVDLDNFEVTDVLGWLRECGFRSADLHEGVSLFGQIYERQGQKVEFFTNVSYSRISGCATMIQVGKYGHIIEGYGTWSEGLRCRNYERNWRFAVVKQ